MYNNVTDIHVSNYPPSVWIQIHLNLELFYLLLIAMNSLSIVILMRTRLECVKTLITILILFNCTPEMLVMRSPSERLVALGLRDALTLLARLLGMTHTAQRLEIVLLISIVRRGCALCSNLLGNSVLGEVCHGGEVWFGFVLWLFRLSFE